MDESTDIKILSKEVDNLKLDVKDFKDYTYGKFAKLEASIDSSNSLIDTLRIEMTKFTTLFSEKFNQLEKKLERGATNGWLIFTSIGAPIITGIILYVVLK